MTVLYGRVDDSAKFQAYYFATHVPITKRMPGLRSFTVSDGPVTGPDGSPAQYELVAELVFDSGDALQAALASQEGQAAVSDLRNFASGGVTIMVFKTREP
jgi:uncharacterized protein (TIGR02118 family)